MTIFFSKTLHYFKYLNNFIRFSVSAIRGIDMTGINVKKYKAQYKVPVSLDILISSTN